MIKSELIQKIANENPHLSTDEVQAVVDSFIEELANALARGDRVELKGFGTFSVKQRPARTTRNPKTGQQVAVGAKWLPQFRAGKLLRDRVGDDDGWGGPREK